MWYKDGQEFTENEIRALNPNTLYGTPFNPDGYTTILDTPQPTITELEVAVHNGSAIDTLGNRVRVWVVNRKFATVAEEQAYLAQLASEAQANAIKHFTDVTTAFIQSKIDMYNLSHGVAFKDIDAFAKYALVPTSSYNAISVQFISYADRVWSAVRAYQASATSIPTDASFQVVLDSAVF